MVILLIFALLLIPAYGMSVSKVQNSNFSFKYVKLGIDAEDSSLNISQSEKSYVVIHFEKIYVGSEDMVNQRNLHFWQGDLSGMNVKILNRTSVGMGRYIHIIMWKNLTLRQMGRGQAYPLDILFDFYAASKNYSKNGVLVSRNMLRYDVKINTDCPGDYIFLEHSIDVSSPGGNENMYFMHNHNWKEMGKTQARRWMNLSDHAEVGFGSSQDISFSYLWNANSVKTIYSYWGGILDMFFVYENTGRVVQDPYLNLSVPIYVPSEEVNKVVNYFMQHVYSILIGLVIAMTMVAIPVFIRRRNL